MATWPTTGNSLSGVARKNLIPYEHSPDDDDPKDTAVYSDNVGLFTVPGTVDAEIITRVQYDIPENHPTTGPDAGWALSSDVVIGAAMSFSSGDFSAHPGKSMEMVAYVVASTEFDEEDAVPAPSAIITNAATVHYIAINDGTGVTAPGGPFGFTIIIPSEDLEANTKYWVCLTPVAWGGGSDITPLNAAAINVFARALSFWTNRTPLAPTITSPASGTVVTAGRDVTFTFEPNDPDGTLGAPDDFRPWSFQDMSGLQVQYAPRPTISVPDPEWIDLPIASNKPGYEVEEGPGWWIEYADVFDKYLGARALHHTRTMQIRCGGTNLIPGHGILPSGNWQLRIRTFDYGHACGTLQHQDEAVPGYGPTGTHGTISPTFDGDGTFPDADLTPDTMPEVNTSPWSLPINLTVSVEVPPPVPVSIINHVAISEDKEVVLHWNYRNTHSPALPQEARQVQIRRRGETDWVDLVSGNSAEHFYSVSNMEPDNGPDPDPLDPPYEYMDKVIGGTFTELGFEDGTVGNWETNSPGVITPSTFPLSGTGTDVVPTSAHSGDYALVLTTAPPDDLNSYPFRNRFNLRPEDKFFSFKAWAFFGPNTTRLSVIIWLLDGEAEDSLPTSPFPQILYTSDRLDFENDGIGEWKYVELLDLPKPPGVTQCWYQVSGLAHSNADLWDSIDDMSVLGSPTLPVEPEPIPALDMPVIAPQFYPLAATVQYEWRVRVADSHHVVSDWSQIGSFWVVPAPGSGPITPFPGDTIDGATLGCGTHRIEVYRRGGKVRVGELTQVSYLDYGRLRDDISDAKIVVSGWDVDCGNLLKDLQTWAYEVVIWRDNGYSVDRVWEGPITLLTYENSQVTINAKDVVAYLYRRIIKQTVNDSGDAGGDTVVARAARIIQNVMAPDDPNVLAYLQPIPNDTDAREYRNLPAWSRTAYEEIDDMAANAGLDYTAVGRAILLWGTKSRIGTLPELRDSNLGSSPIVSEYGMSMANVYAVSDGNGVVGAAYRLLLPEDEQTSDEIYGEDGSDVNYGLVEMLSSSWASDSEEQSGTFTEEGLETVQTSFSGFAERSIADRYPPPVVVRVPDNTTLNPNTVISFQNLVPGVVIPLRSGGTLRVVKANQKLDSVKVVETAGTETISITLSPFNHDDLDTGDTDGPDA